MCVCFLLLAVITGVINVRLPVRKRIFVSLRSQNSYKIGTEREKERERENGREIDRKR